MLDYATTSCLDPQSVAAVGVVILTAFMFLWRLFKSSKNSCVGGCGCPLKPNQKALGKNSRSP
jgi:hypothetical protein